MANKEILVLSFTILLSYNLIEALKTTHLRNKRWDYKNPTSNPNTNNGDMSEHFRGVAGVDYPDLRTIPTTSFRCEDQVYDGGLYADVETQCQVYHICHEGRKDSFLCGKGTIFNQQILACDYWYSADCESAPNYYHVNSQIGNNDNAGTKYDDQGNPIPGYHQGGGQTGTGHNQGAGGGGNWGSGSHQGGGSGGHIGSGSHQGGGPGGPGYNQGGGSGGHVGSGSYQGGGQGGPGHNQGGGHMGSGSYQGGGPGRPGHNQGVGSGGHMGSGSYQGGGPGGSGYNQGGGQGGSGYNQGGGQGGPYTIQGNKHACRCARSSYKNPWDFPAGTVDNSNDK